MDIITKLKQSVLFINRKKVLELEKQGFILGVFMLSASTKDHKHFEDILSIL